MKIQKHKGSEEAFLARHRQLKGEVAYARCDVYLHQDKVRDSEEALKESEFIFSDHKHNLKQFEEVNASRL